MTVRITSQKAALYCDETNRAFGPVFSSAYEASLFLEYVRMCDDRDPATIPADELNAMFGVYESREPSDVEMFGAGSV